MLESHSLWGHAPGLLDHIFESKTGQVLAHVVSHFGPNTQENALSLVVTSPVTVGLTEVTGDDWSINCGHNFGQSNGRRVPREDVAATDATLGANQANTLKAEQDLFEVRLGEARALSEVANRDRQFQVASKSEAQ